MSLFSFKLYGSILREKHGVDERQWVLLTNELGDITTRW